MAYRPKKEAEVEKYVQRFMKMIEIRDMGPLTYFLGVRVIYKIEEKTIHMIQDSYMNKLAKCKTYASTQSACWSREWGLSIMYIIDLCP